MRNRWSGVAFTLVGAGLALVAGITVGPPAAAADESGPASVRILVGSEATAGRLSLHLDVEAGATMPALKLVALPAGSAEAELSIGGDAAGLTVRAGRPMVLRGLRVLPLLVEEQAASAGKAEAPHSLDLEVRYSAASAAAPSRALEYSAGFFSPFLDLLPATQRAALQSTSEGGYLIITAPEFQATLDPLIAWKRDAGFAVTVVTTLETGTRNDQIRDWIRNYYAGAAVPPQYLLLVGDVDRLPGFDYHQSVSDHSYSLIDGDDFLPDIQVGRLSALGTQDLATIVAKIVNYEKTPDRSDPEWFSRALLVAGNYSSSTPVPVMRWCRDELMAQSYAQVDTVYYPPHWATGPTLIRPIIDRGVSLVAYRGWAYGWQGWEPPKFTVEHIPALANGWRLPVVMSFVCLNGDFTEPECFGEAWIRSGTVDAPKGAVGFIGNSEHWSHTRFNDAAAIGVFTAFGDGERALGNLLNAAKFGIMTQFPDILEFEEYGEESVEFYFHIYSLLGDPSLEIWSTEPDSAVVTHATAIPRGANLFEVSVERAADGTPVAGARVGLVQDGILLGSARSDESGVARVSAVFERADVPVTVTVSGAGLLPVTASVPVVEGGPYLALAGIAIRDDGTGGSQGNADGEVNPGETIALEATLENRGATAAPAGTATLTVLAGAEVTTGTASFPAIASGASVATAPFIVTVAADAEDGLSPGFRLNAFSGADSSVSGLSLVIKAPALRHTGHTIGGDGVASPGDTVAVLVTVQNDGALAASVSTGTLRALDPAVATVEDSTASFPALASGAAGESLVPFSIIPASDAPRGQTASFVLELRTAEGYTSRTTFGVRLGPVDHRAPLGPDAYGYHAVDNTDTDYPNVTPVYEWVPCSPVYGGSGTRLDLGDNTSVVVGLPFDFTFYGRTYRRLLVSDNGWAAFDTTATYDYYNWSMPNPYNNGAMIAPFWDNLDPEKAHDGVRVGDGIYVFHDTARHRYVIEWSRLGNFFSQHPNHEDYDDLQTFELILFDPAAYPTPTGDGLIRFQYKQVFNNDDTRMYSTVGIENEDEDVGLEYSYTNLYPDTAAPLSAGLAIDFTTAAPLYSPFRLAAFSAQAAGGGVALSWQPVDERPRSGYRVYRSGDEGARRLLPDAVLGGDARGFLDSTADPDSAATYWIGSLDPVGHESLLGPFAYPGRGAAPRALEFAVSGQNPFAAMARLTLALPGREQASVRIYSVTGRLVRTLDAGFLEAGIWTLEWNGRDESGRELPSGVYVARLEAGLEEREAKLVLIR